MGMLGRLFRRRRETRPPAAVMLFKDADRFRREGRVDRAMALVTDGLHQEPDNMTGHLLAAYLHVANRQMAPAKSEFSWLLARDPAHPRALLGLARIALEESDVAGCRLNLEQAVRFYPDFPEAQALLEAITGGLPPSAVDDDVPPTLNLYRLRPPAGARDLRLFRRDGKPIAPLSDDEEDARAIAHLAQVLRLASATLTRSGLSAIRRGVIEDESGTTFVRRQADVVLALTLQPDVPITDGLLTMNRVWAQVGADAGVGVE